MDDTTQTDVDIREGDKITISYNSVYTNGRVEKDVKVLAVQPKLAWEDHASYRVQRQDGTKLYITNKRDVWSQEETEAGIVVKEKREIGSDAQIIKK